MGIDDLSIFINKFRQEKGRPFTHTSIGSPKVSLNIPDDNIQDFNKLYRRAIRKGTKLHFTEKPLNPSSLRVDLDFRFNFDNDNKEVKRYYTEKHIKRIIDTYFEIINSIYDIKGDIKGYVLEKPHPSENNDLVKDGIHLIFPEVILSNKEQHYIRNKIINKGITIFCGLPITNDYENIVDKAIIDNNGWQMYGSCKPLNETYEVTRIYNYNIDTGITEISHTTDDDEYDEREESFLTLFSMRRVDIDTLTMKDDVIIEYEDYIKNIIPKTDKRSRDIINKNILSSNKLIFKAVAKDPDVSLAKKLMNECINSSRADNYIDWISMGWVLRNIDYRLLEEWIEFSKHSTKYKDGECEKNWEYMKEESMGMGTLRWWAKQDTKDRYNEIIKECIYPVIDKAIRSDGTNFDVAMIVYTKYNDEFKFVNGDLWYKYSKNKHKWCRMNEALDLSMLISTEIVSILNDRGHYWLHQCATEKQKGNNDMANSYNEMYEKCCKIIHNCKTTSFKTNVIKECKALFNEPNFESMLDSKSHLLGFKNGVYDLNMKSFREGEPNDFISFCTNRIWGPYNDSLNEIKEINAFLEKIFINQDVRKYVLETLACSLNGSIHQERFYVLTGSGANGKSRLMDLIEKCVGDYYTIVPVSLLTNKRAASNSAQGELVRTKGKRFAVMQEPCEGDKINIGLMKELSGNDTITARGLYKENVDFKPQFKMFMTCNDLPDVPSNDGGTWRRIRVLQFKSKFCEQPDPKLKHEFLIDTELSDKFERWADVFISMLIEIHNNISLLAIMEPDDVKLATAGYKKNNDIVGQFIDEIIEKDNSSGRLAYNTIWNEYKSWSKQNMNSRKPFEKQQFKGELEKTYGKLNTHSKGWKGIKIRSIEIISSSENDDSS
jgi:P4 family phage/plasmid primase-like protien